MIGTSTVTFVWKCETCLILKRIVVQLSDSDAQVLKLYAAKWNMTLSQALEEMSRSHIHGSASCCTFTRDLLDAEQVPIDKRAGRSCFGFKCRSCVFTLQCRTGIYQGEWKIDDRYKHLLLEVDENSDFS